MKLLFKTHADKLVGKLVKALTLKTVDMVSLFLSSI